MIVRIEPYQATLDVIQDRLTEMGKGSSMREVLKKAINDVSAQTKESLHQKTREEYTIKRSAFKKSDVKREAAKKNKLESMIRVAGKMLGLRAGFKTKKNSKKKAAQAMVLTKSAMKKLEITSGGRPYKAFVASMKNVSKSGAVSSHTGIFRRIPGKYMKNYPNREKIGEIMAISKAQAAGMVYVRNSMWAEIHNEMSSQLLKHMHAVIGG